MVQPSPLMTSARGRTEEKRGWCFVLGVPCTPASQDTDNLQSEENLETEVQIGMQTNSKCLLTTNPLGFKN